MTTGPVDVDFNSMATLVLGPFITIFSRPDCSKLRSCRGAKQGSYQDIQKIQIQRTSNIEYRLVLTTAVGNRCVFLR